MDKKDVLQSLEEMLQKVVAERIAEVTETFESEDAATAHCQRFLMLTEGDVVLFLDNFNKDEEPQMKRGVFFGFTNDKTHAKVSYYNRNKQISMAVLAVSSIHFIGESARPSRVPRKHWRVPPMFSSSHVASLQSQDYPPPPP